MGRQVKLPNNFFRLQRAQQTGIVKGFLLSVLFLPGRPTKDEALSGAYVAIDLPLGPSHLTIWIFGIRDPVFDKGDESSGPPRRDILAVNLIAPPQQPVDLIGAATTSVHADDRA